MNKTQTLEKLEEIEKSLIKKLKAANSTQEVEELKIQYLGRKSEFTEILKSIKNFDKQDKIEIGKRGNEIKNKIETELTSKLEKLKNEMLKKQLKDDWIDLTIPGKRPAKGTLHPITQLMQKTEEIFEKMGFDIELPYEIDDDFNNFEAVNIPKGHPARDAWDTFWTEKDQVLITHTSSMQNRVLKNSTPPIRTIVPGKCFRNEATDARHEHTFYQVEGIYVDKGITITDMLGTLKTYFEAFFEQTIEVKFMPDYFPFVEPGGQMALTCVLCDGKGCKVCKGSGWLEILGCGMIHPNVLKMAGIDPKVYTGFAWGFGLERLIMLKHNINDIRLFHKGDLRFTKQFN